jgi:hypothetical protein
MKEEQSKNLMAISILDEVENAGYTTLPIEIIRKSKYRIFTPILQSDGDILLKKVEMRSDLVALEYNQTTSLPDNNQNDNR